MAHLYQVVPRSPVRVGAGSPTPVQTSRGYHSPVNVHLVDTQVELDRWCRWYAGLVVREKGAPHPAPGVVGSAPNLLAWFVTPAPPAWLIHHCDGELVGALVSDTT